MTVGRSIGCSGWMIIIWEALVKTKYLLLHESGESLELAGYGHGIDSQDKGAGKATTYAMKNALL